MKQSEIIKIIIESFKADIELENAEKKSYIKDLEFIHKGLVLREKVIKRAT